MKHYWMLFKFAYRFSVGNPLKRFIFAVKEISKPVPF